MSWRRLSEAVTYMAMSAQMILREDTKKLSIIKLNFRGCGFFLGGDGRHYYVNGRQAGSLDRRHHYGIWLHGDDSQALYAPTYRFRVH